MRPVTTAQAGATTAVPSFPALRGAVLVVRLLYKKAEPPHRQLRYNRQRTDKGINRYVSGNLRGSTWVDQRDFPRLLRDFSWHDPLWLPPVRGLPDSFFRGQILR